jgi:HSP20 family molecular chaperone IbpA
MDTRHTTSRETGLVRRYDYPDRTVVAADVGVDDDAVHVDAVGETAIVVVDRDDGEEEFEVDLPAEATRIETTNGVLTITVDR